MSAGTNVASNARVRGHGFGEREARKDERNVKNIIGRKVGMTSVFLDDGRFVPVTVVEAGPCLVTQRKTADSDGYEAVQLAFGDANAKRVSKPMLGHFKKTGAAPKKFLREFRDGIDGIEAGQTVTVADFTTGDRVDVVGISKGHGFSGGIKRHNFSGGGASHGSMIHRQPASNGDTNAGRTVKGSRRPGHYGVDRVTHQNLEVVRADAERNLLLLRGPVPGAKNALVVIQQSVKVKGS
ncbi:50S ribosomal protein L3 [bacterium]|nr:MAG: 50S ribosomal protein L3 [bacterium]